MTELSHALAGYLGKQLGLDEDKTDVLRYGFEVILGESAKILVLFLFASFFDLTPYVLVSFLTIGSFRLFAGGYHSKTYGRCFVHSLVLFLGMGKLIQVIVQSFRPSGAWLFTLTLATFLLTFMAALKWAPAETPNKPLSLAEGKRQKKLSLLWVGFWFILVSSVLLLIPLEKSTFIIVGTIMAHMVQTFSVTPAGFKFLQSLDTLADKFIIQKNNERSGLHG
ncbi:accessory gene regulator ArgB-like protein [Paradesulfitobacterium ferrireducens]|uniref:accessory gene regulator ArgB-like protein n=1 Tax=Paradesulfitobacterium ferrireducens TaxID=2816476 RepID=UPI001A8E95E0|nr:accessory gene regulator B family protein [Paradesulfitobacterium ferrireducens]